MHELLSLRVVAIIENNAAQIWIAGAYKLKTMTTRSENHSDYHNHP
jgi:hypothetical protein